MTGSQCIVIHNMNKKKSYKNEQSFDADRYGNVGLYYRQFYSKMMGADSSGLMKYLAKYPHRLMERPFKNKFTEDVIEVGAGSGEHLSAVRVNCASYTAVDLDLERLELLSMPDYLNLTKVEGNATALEMPDDSFDRLIATCLIVHLDDTEKALSEWRRVVKNGGFISMFVPCEPGLALRIFRKTISARKASKLGFEGFDLYIARDHKKSANNVLATIGYIFRNDKICHVYRPLFLHTWYFNLFMIVQIEVSK